MAFFISTRVRELTLLIVFPERVLNILLEFAIPRIFTDWFVTHDPVDPEERAITAPVAESAELFERLYDGYVTLVVPFV